jgi:PAS domain S-box-containing protein
VEVLARIRSLLSPPEFGDEETSRLAAVVYRVTLALAAVAVIPAVLLAVEPFDPGPRLRVVMLFIAATGVSLALTRTGRVRAAAGVLVAAGWLSLALGLAATRLASGPALSGFVLSISAAGLLLGPRAAFVTALVSSLAGPIAGTFVPAAAVLQPAQWVAQISIYFGAAVLVSIAMHQAERSMARARQSEIRFRALAENAGDMIFELDETGRFIYANELAGAARKLRRLDDTVGGRGVPSLHPDDVPAVLSAFSELSLVKGRREVSCRVIDENDEIRWIDSSAKAFVDADGRPRVVVVSRDVTPQREIEAALRDSEARYRMLAEHAPDMIVEHDASGRIVYANARTLEFSGFTLEELGRLEFASWTHPDDLDTCLRAFGEVLREGRASRAVHRLRRADGEYVWLASSGAPVVTASGEVHMIAQSRDLTEELSLQEQLRQAQKMEAIGRLAGGVAHDFNNLLTVIGGYAGVIEGAVARGTPASAAAHEIQDATERAAELARQLLALSRRQLAERRVVDLNAAIRGLEPVLRRALPESIALELALDPELPAIEMDPSQLDQVLLNLALNARDAMRERGTLRLTTRRGDAGQRVHLEVSDTGVGMDEATRTRAFEPFFTTKESGVGSGLGLSTTYGIVRQAGGTIELDSAPGEGTRVAIELPAARAGQPWARAGRVDPGAEPLSRDATILLVEDDASVRRLLVIVLEGSGYRVLAAADAGEALALAQSTPEIDLRSRTTYARPADRAVQRVAARWPGLRVVLMTGHAEMPDSGGADLPRGVELISKPFTREQLGAELARKLATA